MADIKQNIKKFWDDQAKQYGNSSLAPPPDTIAFKLELEQLLNRISDGCKVLDIGCGNGIKGLELAEYHNIDYTGIDFSEEMVRKANENLEQSKKGLKGHVRFIQGDVLCLEEDIHDFYDIVIISRFLINLISIEEQIKAMMNIYKVLKKDGTYLMIENSIQSLNNLNNVRESYGLEKNNVRWHNLYIDEDQFFPQVESYYYMDEMIPFASTYYLISRTLNAFLTPEGEEIDYLSRLNILSAMLPILGDFSPVKLFVLRKR